MIVLLVKFCMIFFHENYNEKGRVGVFKEELSISSFCHNIHNLTLSFNFKTNT